MYSTVEVHCDIQFIANCAAQTCDTLHGVVNLAQMVNDLEFFGQIHFGRAKTVAYGFFR